MTTRRALLAGLPAALALPAVAAAAGSNLGISETADFPRISSDRPASLPVSPGRAHIDVGGRWLTIDTAAVPRQSVVVNDDTRSARHPDGIVEHWSTPDPGAEYVVLTAAGEIIVTELQSGSAVGLADCRRGFMAGQWNGYRAIHHVRVLGKVV